MTDAVLLDPDDRLLAGRSLVERTLERLAQAGISRVHATGPRPRTPAASSLRQLPLDPDPADAIRRALADGTVPAAPFLLLDGDVAWFDGPVAALTRLLDAHAADPAAADALVLLVRATETTAQPTTRADFTLDPLGTVRRPADRTVAPFVATGLRLVTPRYFDRPGTLDDLRDHAIAAGRLHGLVHDGIWFELATDADLAEAEATLDDRLAGARP